MQFDDLKLVEPLLAAIVDEGYDEPTPIQEQAIPYLLEGRDILGCAQTGTGKTAAFALPILQRLHETATETGKPVVRALVLTPTRELAAQVGESFMVYGRHTKLRVALVFGGVPYKGQIASLRAGVDILVATPGRLIDLMGRGLVNLADLDVFVLDEADRMLDMGFIDDIRKIIRKLPKERQTMFFSATMPPAIRRLSESILTDPVEVAVTPVASTVDLTGQTVFFVERSSKLPLLVYLLKNPTFNRVLVFSKTKYGADRVSTTLRRSGIQSQSLHGNKTQRVRERTLEHFKSGNLRVLVATDIASRGIDVEDISHVINLDMPTEAETYVHRIGRTGRAGAQGTAVAFCAVDERGVLAEIEQLIQKNIRVIDGHPFESPLTPPSLTVLNGATPTTTVRVGRSRGRKRPRRR